MDTTSELPSANPLDSVSASPSFLQQLIRQILLVATGAVIVAGLGGAYLLWGQVAPVHSDSDSPRALMDLRPGSLVVDSDPAGATVLLDGEEVGATPLALANVGAGLHTLTLTAADFAESVHELRIQPGTTANQRITLTPLTAHLLVSSQIEGARVSVDGATLGSAPLDLEVRPGRRVVRIEAEGRRPWQRRIDLTANETRTLDVSLVVAWPDASSSISTLAIIVENEAHARPQAGLDRADIVYEALAEGGITRFLAIFATQEADVVGPVRSARDYFVEWAHEYDAPLVHIGASPQGYAALAASRTADLDEIKGQPGFWRSSARQAPHNAYTSVAGARTALGSRSTVDGSFGGLRFADHVRKPEGSPVTGATIQFGHWSYTAGWTFDPYAGDYLRDMNDEAHLDSESGEQLRASNVLIQWVDSWLIPDDDAGRLQFGQVGSGRLMALMDGGSVEGRWEKRSLKAPTRYFGADGTPLVLNPGPTWIEVMPASGALSIEP